MKSFKLRRNTIKVGGSILKNVEGHYIKELGLESKENKLLLYPPLLKLLMSHTKYLLSLSIWKQYIVWRYTVGSGQINMTLIGFPNNENVVLWAYFFLKYYNKKQYGIDNIEKPFIVYKKYFKTPTLLLSDKNKLKISKEIIKKYTDQLQQIILNSPSTEDDILVYKASSRYPGLPSDTQTLNEKKYVDVPQLPFNSTTYDPTFNFGLFITGTDTSVLFAINIPKGSKVLSVNPIFHAYPFEREIIFPHGVSFRVIDREKIKLSYISKDDIVLEKTQDPSKNGSYLIGEVYKLPDVVKTTPKKGEITLFEAILIE
jgi:hypothetical protein